MCDSRLEAILDWKQAENVIPNIGRRTTESQTLLRGGISRISIKLGDSTRAAFDADFFFLFYFSKQTSRPCHVFIVDMGIRIHFDLKSKLKQKSKI